MHSPLHIVLLHHPDSPAAKPPEGAPAGSPSLAERLLRRLYGAPATLELRIPTWFGRVMPDGSPPPLDESWQTGAERTLLVYLLDARMARRVDGGTGAAWGAHLERALADAAADPTRRSVVPLALDPTGFDVLPASLRASVRLVAGADPVEAILQHLGVRALYLLSGRAAPVREGELQVPIQVFVSHAKADLKGPATDPVRSVLAVLEEHAVDRFFDSSKIAPGEDFAKRIEGEVRTSDVLLVVWTDAWSSRPWCRRELLTAKAAGRPVVVLDALSSASTRAFPYAGNAAWVRWRAPLPPSDLHAPSEEELAAAKAERGRIFTIALLAALRTRVELLGLGPAPDADTVHLGSAPEALDYAGRPGVHTFVYPDPPLPDEERALLEGLGAGRSLRTPLGRIAEAGLPPGVREVVVSVSSPGDEELRRLGTSAHHIETLTDELHLAVLMAGARILYGGLVNYTSTGPSNFVLRLFDLARRYATLAPAPILGPRVLNVPPWPLHLSYGDKELDLFSSLADLERGPTPALDGLPFEPWAGGAFPAITSVPRLVAVGLGLREMRRHVTRPVPEQPARPRILVGGPRVSMGWLPGLVEEALCSLRLGGPLFLLGGFGGAARVVAELLEHGRELGEPVLTEAVARKVVTLPRDGAKVSVYDEALACAREHGLPFDTREAVAAELAALQPGGLAAALRNGLDDADNRELLHTRDGRRIVELVLRGLTQLPPG